MTLNEVPLNHTVIITNIYCDAVLKQRLYDLGLINNTAISPVLVSPFGDPIAYEFRGNIIAIRNKDTKSIEVSNCF